MLTKEDLKQLESELLSNDKAEAVKHLINAIEEMVTAMETMKLSTENLSMTCDKYKKIAEDSEKASLDLVQTIKHIHIALNTYRDQLPPALVDLANEIGKVIMSGAFIKAGVKSNANA
jgi:methyl-accepting chemotaxis protein